MISIAAALVAAAGWRYPLFHVVSLKQAVEMRGLAFDAKRFAADFWAEQLSPALSDSPEAGAVLASLGADANQARKQYGRTVGISRSTFFLMQGEGEIVAVETSRLGVKLARSGEARDQPPAGSGTPDVWLVTGPIFGNAARDATGLIKSQDFPNSQDFNALASAINEIVEQRVLPPLRAASAPGKRIRFVACVEVLGDRVRQPLQLIPLQAIVE